MTTRTGIACTMTAVSGLTAVALAAASWSAARQKPIISSVVVVTLDTTRADRLSPYGFMNVSLPHLERLAREGVVFDRASSVAPLTLPAHTSLFTGLLPPRHGVRDNADPPLAEFHTTLAEILRARGFRTGGFVGSVVLNPDRGLRQGFEHYLGVGGSDGIVEESRQRPSDHVIDDAIRWLDEIGDSRFFLWAHFYDAHRPYDPPEPYRSVYGHNLYVGEIAFADSQIGRLLDALERRQLLDRTMVIVTADHGESLGAHGERDHGIFVYEDVIRVPLIVRAPGLEPLRIGSVVRLTDVMPTILDMLDIPSPTMDGVGLVEVMRGRRHGVDLEAYSESLYPQRLGCGPLRALRDGRFKLIEAPRPELYDLDRDPFEEENLSDARRALAKAMAARLAEVAREGGGSPSPEWRQHAAPELRAHLAALGYVGSAVRREPPGAAVLPDPKDCIGTHDPTRLDRHE